uniref:Candidate secreted effector n=1 Tax=Meloidogyne incognita TaxID=6306 RepID=A0A914NKX5_MELIC
MILFSYLLGSHRQTFMTSKENLNKNDCNLIKKELDNSRDFISFYHNLNKKESSLAQKINRITLNILLDDAEKQEYLFNGFFSNILNRRNTGSLDEIHQMIIENIKAMCSEYGDTSNWGFGHAYGQGSSSRQNKRRNREYLKHSEYSGHQQQHYGYPTGYGHQHIYGYQQGFGDYTGHQQYIGHGHEQYTGHRDYNMGHIEGDMGIQGGSEYHGEEDMDTEDGEFDD